MVNTTQPVPDRTKRLPRRCLEHWPLVRLESRVQEGTHPSAYMVISWLHVSLWGLQLAISLPELKFLQDKRKTFAG